jgi:hypothetical protein
MMESQSLGPDRLSPRARDARGRFARGSSGNPRGRPPGIPNPKRRVPDLVARPLSAQALSHLLDRKPYLLPPLAAQLVPPPLPAISRGEIAPAEGARIARRLRARLRVLRRFARLGKSHAAFAADEEDRASSIPRT